MSATLVVCADIGSTFTKAALVDVEAGTLLATAQHPTTLPAADGTGDVLDGLDACVEQLGETHPGAEHAERLVCSSAGGGLRIAVVGNEELVTAEAGRRVALSSGGKVVLVLSGGLDAHKLRQLRTSEPDVLLLVGGTDGGNSAPLVADAAFLGEVSWPGPVVVAGDVEAQAEVVSHLGPAGTPYVLADNVVPRIGVLAPESARHAIREVFLSHVIGGKGLSSRAQFTDLVLGATPDVVLAGVEVLARELDQQGVVVVDIGGATTDVHSVVALDPEDAELARDVVAPTAVTRTVEGDLGTRWSAATTASAAVAAGLAGAELIPAGERRSADPGFLPTTAEGRAEDETLAAAALVLALRRHAGRSRVVVSPEGRVVERTGKDLREVGVLIGSGGVLRSASSAAATRLLSRGTGVDPEGWQLPEHPHLVVDHDYALAALGLLALARPEAAARLVSSLTSWRGNP